jgi:cell division protein FtsB
MSSPLTKLLSWTLFAIALVVILLLGNYSVQEATMRDYDREYVEYELNYLEKEVARLRAHNRELQQELADARTGD